MGVREYDFIENKVNTVCFNLDQRHIGEFSFHIFKNLVCNYLKLLNQIIIFSTNKKL